MVQGSRCVAWLLPLLLGAGCAEPPEPPDKPEPPCAELGKDFSPSSTGTIAGLVRWRGTVPDVAPFHSPPTPAQPPPREHFRHWKNPNAPQVDATADGVGDVVVFLRG